jgi:sulfur-oxidizing protein SoxY
MTHLIPTRRSLITGGASLAASAGFLKLSLVPAQAKPASMAVAIEKILQGAKPKPGRITIDLPPLVENGGTVPMGISVESPMTAADHVKAIHVFNEKNPQPQVISANFSPRSGRAELKTRVRLADTQNIVALAQMSDGSWFTADAHVIVTIAACLEDLP